MMFTLKEKTCEICGKPFMPNGPKQKYCKEPHYRKCPVCGKSYVEPNFCKFKSPPTTCSMGCRVAKRTQTSILKYGMVAPGNNPEAREKAKKTMRDRYGVEYAQESKEIRQKSINTCRERYGVDNPQQCREIQTRTKNTNIQKYGSSSYLNSEIGKSNIANIMLDKYGTTIPLRNPDIKRHRIETNMEKYGVPYPTVLPEVKEKSRQTSLIRYGTDYPQSSEQVKQRMKDTFIRNYGVDNPLKSKEIIEKINKSFYSHYGAHGVLSVEEIASKIRSTNMKRYGVPYYVMLPHVSRSSGRVSKLNLDISDRLTQCGINNHIEHSIGTLSYDIYIPQANMLLEIDPSYTHNTYGNHWRSKGISRWYHLKKTLLARKNGYRCIHLWDWDCVSKFVNSLTTVHTVYPVIPPEIIPKDAATKFIQQYGLYDVTKNISNLAFIGIRYKTKLMSLMGFRQIDPILNVWELVCIENRFNYKVFDGHQKILKEFIRQYNPSKIISYADFSKTNGESLEALGFKYIKFVMPNRIWSKGRHAIIDDSKIIPEAMLTEHWLPVYNCGYLLYELDICTPKVLLLPT